MRFDFVCDRQAVADIDNSGIFAGALQNSGSLRWKTPQMDARTLVAAVFAPHHAEDAELGEVRFALQNVDNLLVFAFRQAVLAENFISNHRYPKRREPFPALVRRGCPRAARAGAVCSKTNSTD